MSRQVTFGHFSATNGADDSGHAGNEAAGIERRNGRRRGYDLINVCGVAAAHTPAAAAGRGRHQRQCHIATDRGRSHHRNFWGGQGVDRRRPADAFQLREGFDGVSSGTQMVTPRRDLLEGLIGGLLFVQDTPPMKQIEEQASAAAPQPEQQGQTTAMAQQPAAQPSDVCIRQGLRRVYYTQNNHRYWRCAARR